MRDTRSRIKYCYNALVAILITTIATGLLAGCANIGSPEGGPRDYTPPHVVKTSPAMGMTGYDGNKVEITFNEIVNIKDQQKKVVVSPAQRNPPLIKSLGKKISVELRDTMRPETTYVIDFSNSIEDNNEGNQLDGYAFTFSTGSEIDSLRISGIVLNASNLEPLQHVLVGMHSNLSDTAFTRLPLERITRTNDLGQFTIMGLKPGRYHVFALNDVDGDYRMARTEDIAFLDRIIEPSTSTFTSQDTTFTFDHRIDTVVTATHTEFLPNNILLTMFNENYQALYLKTTSRPSPSKLHIMFGAAVDTLPRLQVLQPHGIYGDDWYRLERTARADSLTYWLTDSTLIKADSITVAAQYLKVDSTDHVVWYNDTIKFAYTKPAYLVRQEREQQKEHDENVKRLTQLRERMAQGKDVDSTEVADLEKALAPHTATAKMEIVKKGALEVYDSIKVKIDAPIRHIDMTRVSLEMKHDSLWEELPVADFVPADDYDILTFKLPMQLEPDSSYRLTVDKGAFTTIYGLENDSVSAEFRIKALEEYANLLVRVNVKSGAFIELLDNTEKPIRSQTVVDGVATFDNVPAESYYMRLTLDSNGNGRWDTGNYALHLQPEEVYYFPKVVKLRSNWDVEQLWNIYETALDLQKPEAIKKNKPEKKNNSLEKNDNKKKKNGNGEDEDEDEFNSRGFGNATYSGNKYRDYQNDRNRTR